MCVDTLKDMCADMYVSKRCAAMRMKMFTVMRIDKCLEHLHEYACAGMWVDIASGV